MSDDVLTPDPCMACNGRGVDYGETCLGCGGRGTVCARCGCSLAFDDENDRLECLACDAVHED